ncbi:MAG: hypothetical protein IK075_05875 [Prevotella sp.]|nr:hypothetical protein [Prevotella sp.]
MATLHIFNPEHDIALASNLSNFTAPHAGRVLRADVGYLPALWAGSDDYVLVDHADDAQTALVRLMHRPFLGFVEKRQLASLPISFVEPWGWDLALRSFLLRYGVPEGVLPSEQEIAVIRDLSHRKTAVGLLRSLAIEGTVGESVVLETPEAVALQVERWGRVVLKAPWSSSGRGIRFVDTVLDDYQMRWLRNVLVRQGAVVVEPHYDKMKDFAMEFQSDGSGSVICLGLSLFHTSNGAYTGNILASEEEKREMISRYVSTDLLDAVQSSICQLLSPVFKDRYQGPFGVDMMLVNGKLSNGKYLLHPCVEINLRRTMGHVALALSQQCHSGQVMAVEYTDNHYKFRLKETCQF